MRWEPTIPIKDTLVLLFKAARRRLNRQSGDVAALPNARIVTATTELNKIADDIRHAQGLADDPPSVHQIDTALSVHTVGKILRR
jgi:hypothetical protein